VAHAADQRWQRAAIARGVWYVIGKQVGSVMRRLQNELQTYVECASGTRRATLESFRDDRLLSPRFRRTQVQQQGGPCQQAAPARHSYLLTRTAFATAATLSPRNRVVMVILCTPARSDLKSS
jgi:hypothetical protein